MSKPAPHVEAAWHRPHAAYHAHHINCAACTAAGRGHGYGARCPAGAQLWRAYEAAQPHATTLDKEPS